MRHFLKHITIAAIIYASWESALAQSQVQILDAGVNYIYGEEITFSARIASAQPPQEVLVFFQAEGEANAHYGTAILNLAGEADYRYFFQQGALPPFSQVSYWFQVRLYSGETYTSQRYTFHYVDNRFPWQILEDAEVRVHWSAGDISFGQVAFDIAHIALPTIREVIPAQSSEPIEIYIYASSSDLQSTMTLGGQTWSTGNVSANLDVVLVSIAPGIEHHSEMQQQIPHEMAHLLLSRYAGANYTRLPAWLREGIASRFEFNPNTDYLQALTTARGSGTLIPMMELCTSFPPEAGRAFLAHAQAQSFTRYLHESFGSADLQALITAYANGLDCELGAVYALGETLTQLDQRWQQANTGQKGSTTGSLDLLPYLIILVMILIIPAWRIRAIEKKGKSNATRTTVK